MEKLEMESMDITERNVEKLLELFPEVSTEEKDEKGNIKRKIDFEHLKEVLGSSLSDEKQMYSFTWPGKREADAEVGKKIRKTLRPDRETSVDWDKTKNIYIEGDNLEALKLLQKGYMGKIKMIYIDPPYNTGNDFVYNDKFAKEKEIYDKEAGIKDENGNSLVTNDPNTKEKGQFHSDWCSMIYPRLKLARDLLTEDGVIFISIDDNEQANLRKICDEVFGEDNFVAQCIRRTINSGKHDTTTISPFHEYVIIYAKNLGLLNLSKKIKSKEERDRLYKEKDEYENERGRFYITQLNKNSLQYSDGLNYPIVGPDGVEIYPGEGFHDKVWIWRWSKQKVEWGIKNEFIVFKKSGDKYKVYTKSYEFMDKDGNKIDRDNPYSTLEFTSKEYGNFNATPEIEKIFDGHKYFDFPKSTVFIKELLKIANIDKDSIVLDFFSGSATTAHAVMQLNAEDGGNRRFILMQLPEITYKGKTESYEDQYGKKQKRYVIDPETNYPVIDQDSEARKAGYWTICDIGKERIRRAGNKIKEENEGKDIDTGFRVFKIDESNMNESYYMPEEYEQGKLKGLENNIKEGRTDEDLLFGVMLDYEMEMSLPYETQTICGQKVYIVKEDELVKLVACFGNNIEEEVFKQIAEKKPKKVVFKDGSFKDDAAKMNTEGIFKRISPNTDIRII